MTKLIPLSRTAATAAVTLGTCLAVFSCPGIALAAKETTTTGTSKSAGAGEKTLLNLGSESTTTHTSGGGASIGRTVVGLAIVIAVIWGLSWILRQVKSGRDPQVGSAGLASVSALTLSTGRSVHLVRAGNEYVLLASAEHGVVPIHRYTEQQALDAGLLASEEPSSRSRTPRGPGAGTAAHGRHDPMRMPSPSSLAIVERLREWTVRR